MSVSGAVGVGGDGGGEGWGRGWKKGLVVHFMVAVVGVPWIPGWLTLGVLFLQDARREVCTNSERRQRRRRSDRGRKMSTDSAITTLKNTHGEQGADSSPSSSRSEMSPSTPSQQRRHPGPPPRLPFGGPASRLTRWPSSCVSMALMSWPVSACGYQRGEFCSRPDASTSLVVDKRLVPRRESLQDQLASPLSLRHRDRFDGPVRERPKVRVQAGRISPQIQGGANHQRPKDTLQRRFHPDHDCSPT